jgi:hypothetical protein
VPAASVGEGGTPTAPVKVVPGGDRPNVPGSQPDPATPPPAPSQLLTPGVAAVQAAPAAASAAVAVAPPAEEKLEASRSWLAGVAAVVVAGGYWGVRRWRRIARLRQAVAAAGGPTPAGA